MLKAKRVAKITMFILCLGAGAFLALAWPHDEDAFTDYQVHGVMDATR